MATDEKLPILDEKFTLTENEKAFYATVQPEINYDRSIFIVGLTGAGKSQFCNFLADKDEFKTGGGIMSVTEEPAWCTFDFNNEKVFLLDTPGFCDSVRTEDEIVRELCKIGVLARYGSDAVALVISGAERFGDNLKRVTSILEQLGGSFWKHCFIIFTKENEVLEANQVKTGEEYIEEILGRPKYPPILKEMLEKSENRYMFVESKANSKNVEYRNEKCNQIFKYIDQIRKATNTRYDNSLMEQGQRYFRIQELRKEIQSTLKEEILLLKREYEPGQQVTDEPHIEADEKIEKKGKESGYIVSKGKMKMNLFSGNKTVTKKAKPSKLDSNLANQTADMEDTKIMEYKYEVVTAAQSQSWSEWFQYTIRNMSSFRT